MVSEVIPVTEVQQGRLYYSLFGGPDISAVFLTASRTVGGRDGELLAILCCNSFIECLPASVKSGQLEVEQDHKRLH